MEEQNVFNLGEEATSEEETALTDEEISQMLEEGKDTFTGEPVKLDELSDEEQEKAKEWQKKYTLKRQKETAEIKKMQEQIQKQEELLQELNAKISQSPDTETEEEEYEELESDSVSSLVETKLNEKLAEVQMQKELEEARATLPGFREREADVRKVFERDLTYEDAYWVALKPTILSYLEASAKKTAREEPFVETGSSGQLGEENVTDETIVKQIMNAEGNVNRL